MKTFVVYAGPETVIAIKANSKDQAYNLFAESRIDDVFLSEEINTFIINGSLLSKFYCDEKGSFFDDYTGEYPNRILAMPKDKREEYVENHIQKNIRSFWSDKPEFAEEYLKEYKKAHQEEYQEEMYTPSFSKDFYIDTIKRIINTEKWYDGFEIVEIDLADKDLQVIYDK